MTAGKLSKGCCNKHKKTPLPRKTLSEHKSELWAAQNLSVCDLHSRGAEGRKNLLGYNLRTQQLTAHKNLRALKGARGRNGVH